MTSHRSQRAATRPWLAARAGHRRAHRGEAMAKRRTIEEPEEAHDHEPAVTSGHEVAADEVSAGDWVDALASVPGDTPLDLARDELAAWLREHSPMSLHTS